MATTIKTHIPGFDKLVDGGIPSNSLILLSGTAGTGKTIFSMQFLYNGAVEDKEVGIYFTFEEKKEALVNQAKQFGWDLPKLERSKKLRLIEIGSDDIDKNTAKEIISIIKSTKAKRVVIDSITTLSYLSPENTNSPIGVSSHSIKRFLYSFLNQFKELEDTVVLFVSQRDEELSDSLSKYLCDGVLEVSQESLGGLYSRTMHVKKMRRVKNNDEVHSLEISDKGIAIHQFE